MSSFVIKIIAIITMLLDHTGDAVIGHLSILNIIGRIAFPLFAFQLVIGYANTHNLKKYALRLLIFAVISQVPFSIFSYCYSGSFLTLNIFFTLLLGILAMYIYDYKSDEKKVLTNILKTISIAIIVILARLINVDYQALGVLLILFIHIFYPKKNKTMFIIGFLIISILRYISYFNVLPLKWIIPLIVFTFLPIIFMLTYNGKKGPSIKYFFYAFYPIHLAILTILHYFI